MIADSTAAPLWLSYAGFVLGCIGTIAGGAAAAVAYWNHRVTGHSVRISAIGGLLESSFERQVAPLHVEVENTGRGPVTLTRFFIQVPVSGRYYVLDDEILRGDKTPLRLEGNDAKELTLNAFRPLYIPYLVATAQSIPPKDPSTITVGVGVETGLRTEVRDNGWSMTLQDFWDQVHSNDDDDRDDEP